MSHPVCPWWLGYALLIPLRRLVQDPATLLAPLVREGMTVLEPGPGMGFFTLEAARRVGDHGRVIAVDVQPRMLAALRRRAERAGVGARIETREARPDTLGVADLAGKVDLALALLVVHETADPGRLFAELRRTLAPGGRVLFVEPRGHVRKEEFEESLAAASWAGLVASPGPKVWRSWSVVLTPGPTGRPAA